MRGGTIVHDKGEEDDIPLRRAAGRTARRPVGGHLEREDVPCYVRIRVGRYRGGIVGEVLCHNKAEGGESFEIVHIERRI